jgi:hypothetical protein
VPRNDSPERTTRPRFARDATPREQRHFERIVQGYVRTLRAPTNAAADAASRVRRFAGSTEE